MIEAALFDLGDTLFHFELANPRAVLEPAVRPLYDHLAEEGWKLPPFAAYLRIVRRQLVLAYLWSRIARREVRFVQMVARGLRRSGIRVDAAQTLEWTRRHMLPVIHGFFKLDDDALSVVSALHQAGLKLGVVSNTMLPGFAIDDSLEHCGLLKYFPVRIYSSEVGYMKPNRRIFRIALEALGTQADRTVFIGDHLVNDLKGASRMGMQTVLASPNGAPRRMRIRPGHMIARLAELPAVLGVEGHA